MRCNICGSMDADIRPIELTTARITLRAHVDCNGHGQYRPISREEIKEATNKEARILNAIPKMLEVLQQVADLQNPRFDGAAYIELVTEMDRLADLAQDVLAKIEGGGDGK